MTIEHLTPLVLAQELYSSGWKWAVLERDGITIGGVRLDTRQLRRIWWTDDDSKESNA